MITYIKEISRTKITIFKYVFSILLTFLVFIFSLNIGEILISFIELSLIFLFTEILFRYNRHLAVILNLVLVLLYNISQSIQIFGKSYLTYTMLTNLDSLNALSGKASIYIFLAIILSLFSLLPVNSLMNNFQYLKFKVGILILIEIILLSSKFIDNTPLLNYYNLFQRHYTRMSMLKRISRIDVSENFYNPKISNGIGRSVKFSSSPNVILIFTEGLSERVIQDKRMIMPNLTKFKKASVSFSDYYNHTFATYLGIKGQLFSGYQATNYEGNNLISIQEILGNRNYSTTFINTEPGNKEFTAYLNNMGFQSVISPTQKEKKVVSDKKAYEFLYKTANNMEDKNKPFFISMYTFGTHVSLDSEDEVFGDGRDPILNKFYNLDKQFQLFLDKFNQSTLSDNTIIIFTTDHATYVDADYVSTFGKDRQVGNLDRIPFIIYYKGIEAKEISVNGRNSLSLVPTILDFIDVEHENYFLGDSLFNNNSKSKLDTIFSSEGTLYSTKDSRIDILKQDEIEQINNLIEQYYALKQ